MNREELRMFVGQHRMDTQLITSVVAILISLSISNNTLLNRGTTIMITAILFISYLMQIINRYNPSTISPFAA